MLNQSKESSRHVDAVLRALDILDCFQGRPELTMKEILDKTGLTRSRVMRLLGTLEARGYVVINSDKKTFHPGIKLPILAKSFEKNNQVEVLIRPVLKQLALDSGESATFYVRDGEERVALARQEGSQSIRYVIQEGGRYLLRRGGAASKVLLAFGPKDWLECVVADSDKNIIKFVEDLGSVRTQGYATSIAENTPGVHSIAAPVFNAEQRLVGALTISGPVSRMTEEQIQIWIGEVVKTAGFLSERLGSSQHAVK
ncbi:IclR family transcriptional regulator [Desulfocicer niacini]